MPAQVRAPKDIVHDKAIRAAREFIPQEIQNYRKDEIPYLQKGDIDKLTARILENFRLSGEQGRRNVINLDGVVEKIDGRIERDPLFSSDEDITISAEDSTFIIKISSFSTEEGSRFTVAHELGHYLLHYVTPILDHEEPFAYRFFRKETDRFERQANHFAASLTMPKEEFTRKAREFSGSGNFYAELAGYFKVSVQAVGARCKDLGLATTARYEDAGIE